MKYKFGIQARWWIKIIFLNIFKFSATTVIAVQEFWLGTLFLILIFVEKKIVTHIVKWKIYRWLGFALENQPSSKTCYKIESIPLSYFYFYPKYFWCYLEKNLKEKEKNILFRNVRGHYKGMRGAIS